MNITIERVANGWICRPLINVQQYDPSVGHRANHEDIFVFNDIEDLERGLADILALQFEK